MENLIIIGAGGVGRETAMLVRDINKNETKWNLLGFVDDDEKVHGLIINGIKVLGSIDYLNHIKETTFAGCSVSNPQIKKKIINRITNSQIKYAKLVHPSVIMSDDIILGEDVIIQANCIITTNVKIGNHVQLNPQCGIGHDAVISDYCSLYWNVNISGNVFIGEGCTFGTKATVIQGLKIGQNTIIGSASNVIRDVVGNCTVFGNPANPKIQ